MQRIIDLIMTRLVGTLPAIEAESCLQSVVRLPLVLVTEVDGIHVRLVARIVVAHAEILGWNTAETRQRGRLPARIIALLVLDTRVAGSLTEAHHTHITDRNLVLLGDVPSQTGTTEEVGSLARIL